MGKAALKGAVTGLAFGAVGKIAGKAVKAVKVARAAKKTTKVKKTSKVCSVLTKITGKSFCFVAGTEVLTDHGLVPIEKIQVGDLVWAEDPDTGEKALKPVLQLFVSETHELVRLLIEDEIILATTGHPFHVKGKGWVQAFDLEPGDLVTQKDGKLATVYGIWYIYSENPVTVYNFEVADFHTYFVGDDSLLVHNACNWKTIRESSKALKTIKTFDKKQMEIYEDILSKLARGKTGGLHVHPSSVDAQQTISFRYFLKRCLFSFCHSPEWRRERRMQRAVALAENNPEKRAWSDKRQITDRLRLAAVQLVEPDRVIDVGRVAVKQ